jgi:hypothetical protein
LEGVVTLAGFVKSYTDKYEAEAASPGGERQAPSTQPEEAETEWEDRSTEYSA